MVPSIKNKDKLKLENNFNLIIKISYFLFITIFVGLFFALFFEFSDTMPYFSGYDSFYHVGMAKYFFESGIPQEFPYLYHTTLNANFVDHQTFFHLILIPFIQIFGIITGPKIMISLFIGLSFGLIYLILSEKLKFAFLYTIAIFFLMPCDFYFRMAFIRVQNASLLFMLLGIYLMFKNKYYLLFILSFFYVWLYGGFLFLPIIAIIYIVAQLLTGEKVNYKVCLYSIGGTIAGIIINPYFYKNIYFWYTQIFETGIGAKSYSGGEWRPYDTWYFVRISFMSIFVFFSGILLSLIKNKKQTAKSITILVFSIILLILQFKSKRFVEYWPLFAMISGIYLCFDYIEDVLYKLFSNLKKITFENIFIFSFCVALCLIPFYLSFSYKDNDNSILGISQQLSRAYNDTRTLFNVEKAQEAMNYLKNISNEGDIVFTDDWDVFPLYFYLNRKNYYIVGLDPEFMNQYDSGLYQEFADISSGNDAHNLERIKETFYANWVMVQGKKHRFIYNLDLYPNLFELVFDNNDYLIYKVL